MTKEFYNDVYRTDHPSGYGGEADGMVARTASMRTATCQWLDQSGLAQRRDAEILEVGCGMAHLADIHPGWNGIEFSRTAVELVKQQRGSQTRIFEGDAQALPFEDGRFDGILTWAALEHVPDPNRALEELHRVLKGGGHALIAPAWNCRSWTVKKLRERPYGDLRTLERIERALIPVREALWFRALVAAPKRLRDELRIHVGAEMPLRYKRLHPRWDLIEVLGHVSDDDAVANIDPHAAICFFASRRYDVNSHPTLRARVLARSEAVTVQKPRS